jgi:hypothetical protein
MFWAGAPCLDKENAFILAAMSDVSPLALVGGGAGRRAAFICPRGAEDGVMVLGNDPSVDVRREGGRGGEGKLLEGWSIGESFSVSCSWLSESGICKSCSTTEGGVCGTSSISANVSQSRKFQLRVKFWTA